MATEISLTHPNGLRKPAFYGFSWTSLFFGGFPAAFRGDWMAFGLYLLLALAGALFTQGFGCLVLWLVWPFFYNRWHARRLIERGYQITGANGSIDIAKARVMG
ncbi:hypothetical protein BKE38_13655 [Pseudoroseomonas deserti]|uniref:DUF2628 domain-containing protein n=1 Tax=Teichococcus deserti TaxID=1817963 RepID=A0A1V2H3V3_9PROT|nr:hypothetical protein [Pseudoroseomonas deserti]ONG53020.1 hypothetical protein BKE38_13655 [Pseudoroseomonas deserti]